LYKGLFPAVEPETNILLCVEEKREMNIERYMFEK